jgi:hypothetical protein
MSLHKGYASLSLVLTRKVEHARLGSMLQGPPRSLVYHPVAHRHAGPIVKRDVAVE